MSFPTAIKVIACLEVVAVQPHIGQVAHAHPFSLGLKKKPKNEKI